MSLKPDYKLIDTEKLATFDMFLFGILTHYSNMPGTQLVSSVSAPRGSSSPLMGKEEAKRPLLSIITHQRMFFVPFGYTNNMFSQWTEIHSSK
jgi:hypothetical protein